MHKQAYERLLAKSFDVASGEVFTNLHTISGHCLRVALCAEQICEHLRPHLQRTFGFENDTFDSFSKEVQIAALLHDIGKANESFQSMLQGSNRAAHPFRHEAVSVALMFARDTSSVQTPLAQWLSKALADDELRRIAIMIGGHHLKMARDECDNRNMNAGDEFVYLDHESLAPLWDKLSSLTGCSSPLSPQDLDACQTILEDGLMDYRVDTAPDGFTREERVRLSLGKALVIAADTVGSSHTERDEDLLDWIETNLYPTLTREALQEVIATRLGGNQPFPFQREVASSSNQVTLVTAGCGNGKTLAAYLWAKERLENQRLVFCYPTTGTTTAGFQDYLLAQTDLERALMHGRAGTDVTTMIDTPVEHEDGTREFISKLDVWAPDVLDLWRKDVIACTVDSLLGLFAYWRRSMALIPIWTNALFVFDEIHSYDDTLFGVLLDFLRTIHAPTLLMTASLSNAKLQALEDAIGTTLDPIQGNPDIEQAPRYELSHEVDASEEDVTSLVTGALMGGKQILYVANTIGRARDAYDRLEAAISEQHIKAPILLYHSRFKYEDRVNRQEEVIDAFESGEPVLVIATQVCEMSLDLSADLLVTELAPLPSLIQRLGRLNRRDSIPQNTRQCIILEPASELPYDRDALDACTTILEEEDLLDRGISQQELGDALAKLDENSIVSVGTQFLEESTDTYPGTIREASYTLTLIRAEDLNAIPSRGRTRGRITEIELNMPAYECIRQGLYRNRWRRIYGVPIAPANTIDYSNTRGATWVS